MTYSKQSIEQQHKKTVLENGLTIISLKKQEVSSVAIEILVKVGSRYEPLELNGIAHFIEHMNFKGTARRSAKIIAEEFDAIGGYLNAYTSKENTVYSAKVLKEFVPLAIDVMSDIIFNSIYDEEEIEKEKNVVLQELAQTQDSPEEVNFENFSEISFSNQALGRSILGSKENIMSFSREHIIQFVRKYYIASNIIIAAVGGLEHDDFVKLVKEKLVPFSGESDNKFEKSSYTGGCKFEFDPELSQVNLILGYEGISIDSEEYYKLEMLSNILGGSISSRLFQEIREKRGLAYSVGSFCQYNSDSGIFGISLGASKDKIEELLGVLSEEINKITYNITEEEINRCLAQVKSSLYMSRETVDNWASILVNNYACYGRYIPREEIWSGYNSVTQEQLHELAKRIFRRSNPISIAVLGNIKEFMDYNKIHELLTV